MSRRCGASCVLLTLVAACGGTSGTRGAADAGVDASAPERGDPSDGGGSCPEGEALTIGRCRLGGGQGDDDCASALAGGTFVALADEDPVPLVLGPQGFWMVVLAVRATGIAPGSGGAASDNPLVDIRLDDPAQGDAPLARFRARAPFVTDPAGGDAFVSAGLYVVADVEAERFEGRVVNATGRLTDRDGQVRCGEVRIKPQR